jgi:hypothetical protein
VLADAGIPSRILPLFSNIPVAPPSNWTNRKLAAAGLASMDRSRWLLLGIFGAMHEAWFAEIDRWLDSVAKRCEDAGRRLLVVGIGKINSSEKARFDELAAVYAKRIKFLHWSEQAPENISDFLQAIDAGISTVEESFLGKSGAVAAYRDHGLPVLVVRTDASQDNSRTTAESLQAIDQLLSNPKNHKTRPRRFDTSVLIVVQQMLESMQGNSEHGIP